MVVRANEMIYNAPSPQLAQMLLDLLNHRVTPVVMSRGTLGEGDLAQLSNVGQTMIGVGEAYFAGARMSAEQALKRAGLAPLHPFGADDNALTSSNAYATGQAALLVHDAQSALEWADLIYAMDLNGMNSSITPLSRGGRGSPRRIARVSSRRLAMTRSCAMAIPPSRPKRMIGNSARLSAQESR